MSEVGLTLFTVFEPAAWPPPRDYLIHGTPLNNHHAVLYAIRGGKMRALVVDDAGNDICQFVSQSIEISPPYRLVIGFIWSQQAGIRLQLNCVELAADAPGVEAAQLPSLPPDGPELRASQHPDAAANCQVWVSNRKTKFAATPSTKPGRRPKTVVEQAADLSRSVHVLRSVSEQAAKGATHMLGVLAGEIRAITYWIHDTQPDRQYNPLLLRMASLADLPLAAYFPKGGLPPPTPGMSMAIQLHALQLIAPSPTHLQLGDVQEWLSRPSFQFGETGTPLPPKAIVSETANTLGVAHYDEDIPESVVIMRNSVFQNTNALVYFLCEMADVLASMSEGVLSELRTRGVLP